MATDPKAFAAHVAAECVIGAERILALQDAIGDELLQSDVSPRMLSGMQELDALHQTLVDLGEVFARLSDAGGGDCGRRGISDNAVAAAKQAALRSRLTGTSDDPRGPDERGGVELF